MPIVRQKPGVEALLGLAIAEPDRAEAAADQLIDAERDPWVLSVARQARGIVWRDRGHVDEALGELRAAVRLARSSGDVDREADARASFGLSLTIAGRTAHGLEQLGRALASAADPLVRARILMRRGHARYFLLARPREALDDLERALPRFRSAKDVIWEARTLNVAGLCLLALGDTEAATVAVQQAEDIFVREQQVVESVVTLHNRAEIAWCRGDLPLALRLYDEAAEQYAALGEDYWGLVRDRCEVMLAAGLADEAAALATRRIEASDLSATQEAELLLVLAAAQLSLGESGAAVDSASRARSIFRRQQRISWALRAELVTLLAKPEAARSSSSRRLVDRAEAVASGIEYYRPDDAAVAWLLAGRLARGARYGNARTLLDRAAAYRSRPNGLTRATAWHARALQAEADDNRRALLAACRRGLDELDQHRSSLGSSELRALANRHGDELARLALRHVVRTRVRTLLEWSERWRATTLSQPPVRPPDDDDLAADLAALRDTRRRLTQARDEEVAPTAARLAEEEARLERSIRRRTHHLSGTAAEGWKFDVAVLVDAVDGRAFVELVDIDGVLHALVIGAGRVRRVEVGPTAAADQAVAFARFALRQTARGRPTDLDDVGRRLQEALLGAAVRRLGDGPVVVSPPGRLIAAPWALAPALSDVPLVVTPSAGLWLRASAASAPSTGRVLVAGPGLESGGAELTTLARLYPDALLLRDGAATVERTLDALDGAAVAHLAAHGRFRDDSPLFSSLDLDDGPLTVHDFERLRQAPHRVVLSACESGVVAPIGAGEMLGLVAALLAMGSASVVSSVAQVNDRATSELMIDLHAALEQDDDLGLALLRVRQAARGDRVRVATAAAFLGMGA